MKISESQLQQAIVRTVLNPLMDAGKMVFNHCPNGGWRHKATAGRMKSEGVKAGWPDIQIFFSNAPVCGPSCFFIELKVVPNKMQASQELMMRSLRKIGFDCYVVHAKSTEDGCKKVVDILQAQGVI